MEAKIIQIGNSLGITLSREVLSALGAGKGDMLTLTINPDGVRLSAYDAEKSRQIEAVRRVMRRRRHALRELAK